jgi:hypothetical protein
MHARWRRSGASHNAILAVHCDGCVDPERLRRAIERFLDACPWPGSRLRRTRPWGALHWIAGPRAALRPPTVHHHAAAGADELDRVLESELNAAIDPWREPPLKLLVLDTPAEDGEVASVVVLIWFHPLMDPRGAETFLAQLAKVDASPDHSPTAESRLATAVGRAPRPLGERGRMARQSLAYMQTLAPVAPVSPGAAVTTPGVARFRRVTFVPAESVSVPTLRTRQISWRLAVVGRAMAELWEARGLPDVPFLVPISVDLRPTGEAASAFGNQLAFHFARFRPAQTADIAGLARALRRQMADAVRDGQIDANAAAMEFLKYRPLSTIVRVLPWSGGGETFSFHCADTGAFPVRADFFGRHVRNAYHVPCVLPRPGIGVFFNRCGHRDNLVVSWVDGAVSASEAARVVEVVVEEMGWRQRS